jgi:hypothetical protein
VCCERTETHWLCPSVQDWTGDVVRKIGKGDGFVMKMMLMMLEMILLGGSYGGR